MRPIPAMEQAGLQRLPVFARVAPARLHKHSFNMKILIGVLALQVMPSLAFLGQSYFSCPSGLRWIPQTYVWVC